MFKSFKPLLPAPDFSPLGPEKSNPRQKLVWLDFLARDTLDKNSLFDYPFEVKKLIF